MVEQSSFKTGDKLIVVYYTFSGQVKRFVKKLKSVCDVEVMEITEGLKVDKPYVLLTGTYGFGEVSDEVTSFIENNKQYIKAVMSSGNKNWGNNFAKAGDIISKTYNVPLLAKFELSGSDEDVELLKEYILGGK